MCEQAKAVKAPLKPKAAEAGITKKAGVTKKAGITTKAGVTKKSKQEDAKSPEPPLTFEQFAQQAGAYNAIFSGSAAAASSSPAAASATASATASASNSSNTL